MKGEPIIINNFLAKYAKNVYLYMINVIVSLSIIIYSIDCNVQSDEMAAYILYLFLSISLLVLELTIGRYIINIGLFNYRETTLHKIDPYFTLRFVFGCKIPIRTLRYINTIIHKSRRDMRNMNFHDVYLIEDLNYWFSIPI